MAIENASIVKQRKAATVAKKKAAATKPAPPSAKKPATSTVTRVSAPPKAPATTSASPAAAPTAAPRSVFDLQEIRDAMAAITASFNLQRGQQTAEKDATSRSFNTFDRELTTARNEAQTATQSNAAGRGLLRSGLYLQRVGEIGKKFAEQRTAAIADRDARLRAIVSAIAGLTAQEKAERVARAREIARSHSATSKELANALKLAENMTVGARDKI